MSRASGSGNYNAVDSPAIPTDGRERAQIPAALAGLRLDRALAEMFPLHSRSRLQAWLRDGRIRVDGEAAEPRRKVWGGERIELRLPEAGGAPALCAQALPLAIVYEDDVLIVIDKPAGLVVHPGAGNPDRTLMNALLAHAPRVAGVPRAGIVHRLDKDTSGLLVVAKTLVAHTHLVRQLQARSVTRVYLALAHGTVAAGGTIDAPIGRDARSRTRMAVNPRGKPARTNFEVLERFAGATLLRCRLESGRTHQIRVHLQSIGHPLVGDPVYRRGARVLPAARSFGRQALHAAELEFDHPSNGRRRAFRSKLPDDFDDLLHRLRDGR
jgi:23S rRNA pseudouridine1911/1915/1917 synthase